MAEDQKILVQDLSVQRDGLNILSNIHFSLRNKEKCMISGSNGAGKTTFLKTLLGLVKPSGGSVSVLGTEVGTKTWFQKRQRIGYVNQESIQVEFPISVREVVEIGLASRRVSRKTRDQLIAEAMDMAECSHLKARSYLRLSGGERQRVSLARCLVQKPELLFLDEPTASLDPDSRGRILELLDSFDLAILMISHDPEALGREGWRAENMKRGSFLK